MRTLWSLVLLSAAFSHALNLDLALDLDKRIQLRFMRRDVPFPNGTLPQESITTTTTTSSSTTSVVVGSPSSAPTTSPDSPPSTASSPPTFGPPRIPSGSQPSDPGFHNSTSSTTSAGTPTDTTIVLPSLTRGSSVFPPPLPSFKPKPTETNSTVTISLSTEPTSSSSEVDMATNTSAPITTTHAPGKTPPHLPSFTGVFTNSSTSIDLNATTTSPTCTGSVTYYGSVPPTVYVTVTEGFDVTVAASNISVTDAETIITPLPACSATIMPLAATFGTEMTATEATSPGTNPKFPQVATGNPAAPPEPVPPEQTPAFNTVPAASSAVYTSVDYTSTVVVTKKTPVTVVAPSTSSLDINFNFPTKTPSPSANSGGGGGSNNNNGGSSGDSGSNGGNNGNGGNGNTGGGSGPAPTPNVFVSIGTGPTAGTLVVTTATTRGLGNIIASIINSPFATAAQPTPAVPAVAAPLTTTVDGVPIAVLPSNSVAIGGQTFTIPNLRPTTVTVSGTAFTLEPSRIVAPSTTITISQLPREQVITPLPTATITTTVGDLTFTVGPTAAIISGTTYRIGSGAPATTITVDGTRISLGAGGVGLPSTTVAPGGVTGSPFVVYTTEGLIFSVGSSIAIVGGTTYRVGSNAPDVVTTLGPEHVTVSFGPGGVGLPLTTLVPGSSPFVVVTAEGLTFTVDGTEAIISGTTYRIGSSAPQVTTSLGSGHSSVSFGPNGIGLKSTTIHPTAASSSSQTAQTGSRSTSANPSPTQSAVNNGGSSSRLINPRLGWGLMAALLLRLL